MISTPTLVQEAPIVRMTNSVLVGTMKFTLDQLFIGMKETVEGARRMTAVPARKQAGDRLWVFMKGNGGTTPTTPDNSGNGGGNQNENR
jgi:hypothetical protein